MSGHQSSEGGNVIIIGLGVMVPDQITQQASRALSRCSALYSIVQEPLGSWFPKPKPASVSFVNLLELYQEGVPRHENYESAAKIIFAGCRPGKTVGYVTYGNPLFYDSVAQALIREGPLLGVSIEIVPGVSSIDTIMCDLKVDLAPGIQIYEATWLIACQIPLRSDVQALLLQMGSFGSFVTHYTKRRDGTSLEELVTYLSKFYPPGHVGSLVRSTASLEHPMLSSPVALSDLCQVTPEALSGASLHIPAVAGSRPSRKMISRMLRV